MECFPSDGYTSAARPVILIMHIFSLSFFLVCGHEFSAAEIFHFGRRTRSTRDSFENVGARRLNQNVYQRVYFLIKSHGSHH
jgi:hypothetical protein